MIARNHKSTGGQALVEWAIILPVIILITMMIFDFGRIVYYYSVVYNSAREGARYGIVNFNLSDPNVYTNIENKALEKAVGLDPSAVIAVATFHDTNGDYKVDTVRVKVDYSFAAVTPIVWELIGTNPVTVSSQADMKLER